jgi:hypothetical protein
MNMKKILQAFDGASTKKPVEGSNDMKRFLQVMEGKGPLNRLTTAEAMAVQTYIDPEPRKSITSPVLNVAKDAKPSMVGKYFKKVEQEFEESAVRSKERSRQLAEIVANKINEGVPRLSKHISQSQLPPEALNRRAKNQAAKRLSVREAPLAATDDPNDPMIHSHEKANPMTLKSRIVQARRQLQELAKMSDSDELAVWEQICKLSKGGMFMGLEQNLEQIRHGIDELANKRKRGGVASRGIDKNIG